MNVFYSDRIFFFFLKKEERKKKGKKDTEKKKREREQVREEKKEEKKKKAFFSLSGQKPNLFYFDLFLVTLIFHFPGSVAISCSQFLEPSFVLFPGMELCGGILFPVYIVHQSCSFCKRGKSHFSGHGHKTNCILMLPWLPSMLFYSQMCLQLCCQASFTLSVHLTVAF